MQLVPIELQAEEQPFPSIEAMREQHLRLLEAEQANQEDIDTFLRMGVALGRFLDAPELRSEAQNMLDYWVSSLSIQQRGLSKEQARILPAAILERFDASQLSDNIDQASKLFETLSLTEKNTARKLLMRLAPMAAQGDSFAPITLDTNNLTGGDASRLALLEKFETSGLITRIPGSEGKPDQWRLAHESLIHRWPEFSEWSAERRRFRQATKLWDESKRASDRLNTRFETLSEALGYRDLNTLESDFLEASSAAAERVKRNRQFVRSIAIAGGVVLLTLGFLTFLSSIKNKELKKSVNQKLDQNEKLEEQLEKGERELAQANTLPPVFIHIRQERDELRKQLNDLHREISKITQNLEEDSSTPAIQQAQETLSRISQESAKAGHREKSFYKSDILQALAPPEANVLSPGTAVSADSAEQNYGSAGIFLTDKAGNLYLAAPSYVIGSEAGQKVIVNQKEVGILQKSFGKPDDPSAISIAKLNPGIKAENILPSVGAITGWEERPSPGTSVILIGQGSGIRSGKVLRIDKDGTIVTSRISQAGDGGAPVITEKGKLIGFLIYAREDESFVSPCGPLLKQTGLTLLVPKGETSISGALAQIIVPDTDPRYLEQGGRILEELKNAGFFIPDGAPISKRSNPAQIDIRYYHEEDLALAQELEKRIHKLGFNKHKIWKIDDPDPPKKFIQIAFSKQQLDQYLELQPQ